MSDEKDRIELTEIAKPDEDGELLSASQVRELSEFADDIADAEFIDLETGDSPRLDAEDDDEEPIAAEVVEPSPAVASDVRAAEAPDDPLSKFLAGREQKTVASATDLMAQSPVGPASETAYRHDHKSASVSYPAGSGR